jgi:hypothetical protein
MSATKYDVELNDSWHLTIRVTERHKDFEDMVQTQTFSLRRTQFMFTDKLLTVQVYKRENGEIVRTDTVYYEFKSKKVAKQVQTRIQRLVQEAADKNNLE